MAAEFVKFVTTNSQFDKLDSIQKEISGMKVEIKDCNKEIARVSKEAKAALNSSHIANKSSTDL